MIAVKSDSLAMTYASFVSAHTTAHQLEGEFPEQRFAVGAYTSPRGYFLFIILILSRTESGLHFEGYY